MQIKLQFEVLQLPRCLLAQGVVVITVLDIGMELLQRLFIDGLCTQCTPRMNELTRSYKRTSAALNLRTYLVLRVAVEEVRMNGPVEGYQSSLRLWGCQLPRGDKVNWSCPERKDPVTYVNIHRWTHTRVSCTRYQHHSNSSICASIDDTSEAFIRWGDWLRGVLCGSHLTKATR